MGPLETFFRDNKWCKGKFARRADDFPVPEYDQEACKFCLLGATMKLNLGSKYIEKIASCIPHTYAYNNLIVNKISNFNDAILRTKEELMEWLKENNL